MYIFKALHLEEKYYLNENKLSDSLFPLTLSIKKNDCYLLGTLSIKNSLKIET